MVPSLRDSTTDPQQSRKGNVHTEELSPYVDPVHQPPLTQIHQSEQSITEMPSDNENPDRNSSQVQPRGTVAVVET